MGSNLPRRLLRLIWNGLGYCSLAMGMTPLYYYRHYLNASTHPEEEQPPMPPEPAPGHPERLVPNEPLSEEASRLWAQLADLDR
jgi:hypothetical protein